MHTKVATWLHKAGASVLFVGYIPFASGTMGSAVAIGAIWVANHYVPVLFAPESLPVLWVVMVAAAGLSIGLAQRAKELFGRDDPPQVVCDEFAGQLITFFMIPITLRTLLLGFVLFRFFDIIKPYPVHTMEELEGGVGITMDDVMAGIYANLCLMATLFVYHAVKAAL
jgi:phosphatidylglycerophosphatase A